MLTFKINTLEEWQEVIASILPHLKYNILTLKGNLGAGKTTFTQYLIQNLESKDTASSPTYSIVNEYDCPKGKIYHFDLYRIKSIEEAFEIGIEEYLDSGILNIIEWPEVYEPELQGLPYHQMSIENKEGSRYIEFKTI